MAVAYDDKGSFNNTDAAWTTGSVTATIQATANRAIVVGVVMRNTSDVVNSASCGAVSLARIGTALNATNVVMELWGAAGIASGSPSVTVNKNVAASGVFGYVTFNGVDQVTPFGSLNTAGPTASANPAVTVASAVNNLVVDLLGFGSVNDTVNAQSGTQQWNNSCTPGLLFSRSTGNSQTNAGSASVNDTYTLIGSTTWGLLAVEVKAASIVTLRFPSLSILQAVKRANTY